MNLLVVSDLQRRNASLSGPRRVARNSCTTCSQCRLHPSAHVVCLSPECVFRKTCVYGKCAYSAFLVELNNSKFINYSALGVAIASTSSPT